MNDTLSTKNTPSSMKSNEQLPHFESTNQNAESPEARALQEQIEKLKERQRAIDLEIHRLEERLSKVKERKEETYADFEAPLKLPEAWHVATENTYNPHEHNESLPPNFDEIAKRIKLYKDEHITKDVIRDMQEMAEGKLNQTSYANPEVTLLEIYRERYKGWKLSDFEELLKTLPDNTIISEVESFDDLTKSVEGAIEQVRGGGWDYFSPDSATNKINQGLIALIQSQKEYTSPELKTLIEEAEENEDDLSYFPETSWFTYDDDKQEILFEGETIANYTTGDGGSIKHLDKPALKNALEKFLRRNLPFLPRKQEQNA